MRAAFAFLLVTACSPAVRAQFQERQDTRTLSAAAGEYWLALRWNDPGGAGQYLTTAEQRLQLGRYFSAPGVRITDASVVQVVVDRVQPDSSDAHTGIAVVRVESYDIRTGKLVVDTVEQHWVREPLGWKVDPERSPLAADHPW